MLSLYQTISRRSLSRRWLRAGLIAISVGLGVATLVATQALNWTMARAAVFAANPTSGFADLIVSSGDLPVPLTLGKELAKVPGVNDVQPRIFENAFAVDLADRPVLVLGVDVLGMIKQAKSTSESPLQVSDETQAQFMMMMGFSKVPLIGGPPATLAGRELFKVLPEGTKLFKLRRGKATPVKEFALAGPLDGSGDAAALAGFVAIMDISDAGPFFGLPKDQVHRFDLILAPSADPAKVRADVEAVLKGRANVRTFQEQSQTTQNVMAGMQAGFSLCGLAALVVGLFLVYNALAVTVTERRHEIGILRSLGGTRLQILMLFAGEALFLGLIGSLLGIPMGIGLANLGLKPMQDMLGDIYFSLDARQLDVSWMLYAFAVGVGMVTTLFAALLPAFRASRENPAEAVRKVLKAASVPSLVLHIATSATLVVVGTTMILLRDRLPARVGPMGGMCLVLIGGLIASPFFTGLIARLMQPFIRRFLSIEWRLGADNIVRSPGRTGLVIGALAAGVSLVVQTAGVIRSNRDAIRHWVDDAIGADLIVTSGSPVGAGGQTQPMPDSLIRKMHEINGVEDALPVRIRKVPFRATQILILTMQAGEAYPLEKRRLKKVNDIELYRQLDETSNGVIVSENLAAIHKVKPGDLLTLPSPKGEVKFRVLGAVADYSWNHGAMFMHRRDYVANWGDTDADVADIYLKPGANPNDVKKAILENWGATHGLFALTRTELQTHIDSMIEKIYGVAYAQQIVVMIVAGLGVVTALLISVLQRRHEMGLLRAIGASRGQVIVSVLAEACLMGLIGTLIGVLVGVPLQWYVLHVVILEEAGFYFPVVIPWREALLVSGGALLTAILAGLGPAIYAVRQRIPEAIAYE